MNNLVRKVPAVSLISTRSYVTAIGAIGVFGGCGAVGSGTCARSHVSAHLR
jgi:hypothetical protein